MEHSSVYRRIHFLIHLQKASPSERQLTLTNIVPGQIETFSVIAERLTNGVVSVTRRDAPLIRRKRTLLRTLASPRVSVRRKKSLLKRYHSLVPVLLRTPYLIQIIFDEIRTARDE